MVFTEMWKMVMDAGTGLKEKSKDFILNIILLRHL